MESRKIGHIVSKFLLIVWGEIYCSLLYFNIFTQVNFKFSGFCTSGQFVVKLLSYYCEHFRVKAVGRRKFELVILCFFSLSGVIILLNNFLFLFSICGGGRLLEVLFGEYHFKFNWQITSKDLSIWLHWQELLFSCLRYKSF